MTLLNVLNSYEAVGANKDWCVENFISGRALKNAMVISFLLFKDFRNHVSFLTHPPATFLLKDVRTQLQNFCKDLDIPPHVSAGDDVELVLQAFLYGFFQNVAVLQLDGSYKTLAGKQVKNLAKKKKKKKKRSIAREMR